MRKLVQLALLVAFASFTLAGCGGGSSTTSTTTSTSATAAAMAPAAMSSGGAMSSAMSSGMKPSAMMPTCGAGDPVVWVNTKSKVFHSRGDEYFGKTKQGGYMCTAAALAAGNRAAKVSSMSKKGSPAPEAAATKKPRRHKVAPEPAAT